MNKKEVRIITAACLFSTDTPAAEIAKLLDVSVRTVERYTETDLWETTLDTLEVTGNRTFVRQPRRDIERESGKQIEYVHQVWTEIIKEGTHPRNAARLTAERTGIALPKVRRWEHRFGWRDETD